MKIRKISRNETSLPLSAQHESRFCARTSKKAQPEAEQYKKVHSKAKEARDKRLQEEARLQKEQEEADRKKQEEEERKKFMESAMFKETEAKPGMVWNKATGEYQYLHTDESWRD